MGLRHSRAARSHGVPALHYDKNSRGAKAYIALAGEILRRDEQRATHKPDAVVVTSNNGER